MRRSPPLFLTRTKGACLLLKPGSFLLNLPPNQNRCPACDQEGAETCAPGEGFAKEQRCKNDNKNNAQAINGRDARGIAAFEGDKIEKPRHGSGNRSNDNPHPSASA